MQRFGGAVILMKQKSSNEEYNKLLNGITYLIGSANSIIDMTKVYAKKPFDESVIAFLDVMSKELMASKEGRVYPDIITLGFWIRKASVNELEKRFVKNEEDVRLGKGVVFHIAPSNVPVNYAYSLVAGLLTGNANVVRIPSKQFPQVGIINNAIRKALDVCPDIKPYICLVRYEKNKEINDLLSSFANVRVIWGGDNTISELRKSPLSARSCEVTFADRFSLAVIDANTYNMSEKKERIAEDFYNDTYLTDQNACTSPRIVVWIGEEEAREKAKEMFWNKLHELVKRKYTFQPIQGVNKLTSCYLMAVSMPGTKVISHNDNMLVRVNVPEISEDLMKFKDNSGYFFEYDGNDILDVLPLCNQERCQTIAYIGDKKMFEPLFVSGVRGIDRIVPVGKTMDFDLIWDGFDLTSQLTRVIRIL